MISCRLGLLALALVSVAAACKSAANESTMSGPKPAGLCRGLDLDGREFRDKLVRIATSSDSGPVRTRATVGLPQMTADSVILVNDPTVCARAAESLSRFRGPPRPRYETLNVFRLGPVYVVNRPDGHAGIDAWVMDMSFRILHGWGL